MEGIMWRNTLQKITTKIISVISVCLWNVFACDITLSAHAEPAKILNQIATECSVSIVYAQDVALELLNTKKMALKFHKASLAEVLEVILKENDIQYELSDSVIKIWGLQTKTFAINYISTARVGSSNTDVFFSQDSQSNLSGYNNLQNYSNYQNMGLLPQDSQAHKMALNKAASHTLSTGKSGTKIYSIDEMDFWGELENEIYNIAYRPGDWYIPKLQKPNEQQKDIIINKGAGLLTITGSATQIERVEHYLASLAHKMQSQVLIDVNIFNVEHSDGSTYGVDWEQFFNLTNLSTLPPNSEASTSSGVLSNVGDSYAINVFSQGVSIERIVEFLQTYGKVESISNPKVLTLNNQPAIISVGSVLRYSQNTTYQTTTQGTSVQNASQAYPSVFAGILLDVTPSIQNNRIILKINPSITKTKDSSVESQTTALSAPPNLSTKHLSSLVALQNGERIVLGGLIDKTNTKTIKRLPILGAIPLVKYFFSWRKNTQSTKEMVIVISPKIMNPSDKNALDVGLEGFKILKQEITGADSNQIPQEEPAPLPQELMLENQPNEEDLLQ